MKMKAQNPKPKFRLVCFDLDGTIIDEITNFWGFVCTEYGCDMSKKGLAVEKFMNNLITYNEWVEHDVEMWREKGLTREDFARAVKKLKLMKGAIETIKELKKKGLKLAIISDSLDIALEVLMPDYMKLFDDVLINRLFFGRDGKISGWEATKYGIERKADGLRMIAEREKIKLDECVFVGDGRNDIHAAEIAGLSIAFNSDSEELKKASDVVIMKKDLREILRYI